VNLSTIEDLCANDRRRVNIGITPLINSLVFLPAVR
jgi:hypothetical protein